MNPRLSLPLLFLSGCCSLWAQSTSPPAPATTPDGLPPGVKIMRAIPIEEPAMIKPVDEPVVPGSGPKLSYSQCHVEGKQIALTFDDGPHAENTPRLLDLLKERGIKVTFFLVGRAVAAAPHLVKRMVDEGHEIANHSWSHPQLNHMSMTRVKDQLQKTHDAIVKACGVAPVLYRPPYGAILLSQRKTIHEEMGYLSVLWDVDPMDWRSPRSSIRVHDRILNLTKPGSIILCHDIQKETVDAMPSTIDDLLAQGFQFVTVSQLIQLDRDLAAKQAAAKLPVAAAPVAEKALPAAAAAPVNSPVANPPVPPVVKP